MIDPDIALRQVLPDDVTTVVQMIRLMVTDMASYGGYVPATDAASWDKLTTGIAEDLTDANCRFVFAQTKTDEIVGIGGAELITLGGGFAPKKTLHISVVYVRPQFRRRHIANALLADMLTWGTTAGALECDLNVLMNSPAKLLYEKHGFSAFEVKMTRPLI
jgi:ribosomal protein S18 acetylase RimI-like enzyme